MLTVAQLVAFDPARLAADAGEWQRMADDLATSGDGLRAGVATRLAAPSWDGAAAWAARARVGTVTSACDAQQAHWSRTAGVLRDAAAALTDARGRLVAACRVAAANGLTVSDGGTVTPTAAAWAAATPAQRVVLSGMSASLTGDVTSVLSFATTVDATTASTLVSDGGSGAAGSTADATTTPGPLTDAEAIFWMTQDSISEGDVPEILRILEANAGDPAFAQALGVYLGPDGLLSLTRELAGQWSVPEAAAAQAALGPVLATVTDPASPGYLDQEWTDALLGGEHPDHQALGVLLSSGDYSTEFLLQAGDTLEAVENGDAAVWATPGPNRIDLDDPDTGGVDPLVGFMSALGRNPDAAEQWFDPAAHPGRVEYHLSGRDHMPTWGYVLDSDADPGGYRDHVGTALEAAVGGDPHSATSAHVMSEVVHVLGSPDKLNGDVPANMRDSAGRMVAEYIGDVNAHLTNDHVTGPYVTYDADGNPVYDTSFDDDVPHPDGVMDTGTADEAHAIFDDTDLLRVMGAAAADTDGYVAMYEAQTGYAAIVLDTTVTDPALGEQQRADQLVYETDQLSKVFGAIDQARAISVEDLYTEGDAEHNAHIGLAEKAVGGLAGIVADELLESVPGDGLIKAALGPLIDSLFGERDSDDATARAIAEVFHGGRDQSFEIVKAVLEARGLWDESWSGLGDAAGDGYTDGRAAMDEALGNR